MTQTSPLTVGQIVHGKYRIENVLGEGAMGVVVSAWHLGLDQRVAIKMLHRQLLAADSSTRTRFKREARAAAKIHSEHVCRVLDTGELDDGTPFLVMEFMEGSDLEAELGSRGQFTASEAAQAVFQACDALKEAHAAGIVHRDLKPANLFLAQRPDGSSLVKVLDFGVSKALPGSSSSPGTFTLTRTSMMVGSPIYMSPEQLNSSKDVDERTDIWALGSILYELVTGRTPFTGESMPQLVNAVIHHEPATFAELGIAAPAGFEQVILRALRKDREDRFESAQALAKALLPFCRPTSGFASGAVPSVRPEPGSTPPPSKAENNQHASMTASTTEADDSKRRWLWILAALAVVGAGLVFALGGQPSASGDPVVGKPAQTANRPTVSAAKTAADTMGAADVTGATQTSGRAVTDNTAARTPGSEGHAPSPDPSAVEHNTLPSGEYPPTHPAPAADARAQEAASGSSLPAGPATAEQGLSPEANTDVTNQVVQAIADPTATEPQQAAPQPSSRSQRKLAREKRRRERNRAARSRQAAQNADAPAEPAASQPPAQPTSQRKLPDFGGRR